jgi:hypothetical protein
MLEMIGEGIVKSGDSLNFYDMFCGKLMRFLSEKCVFFLKKKRKCGEYSRKL